MASLALASFCFCQETKAPEVGEQAEEVAVSTPKSSPGFDGLCQFGEIYLNDPETGAPLTGRYLELIIVNGEVDLPFATDGDDVVQERNEFYNTGRHKSYLNSMPGLIDILATVRMEKTVPTDNRVQVWENVIVRVFNNDDPELATYYTDSQLWECQPGFNSVNGDMVSFSDWKPLPVR